MMFGHLSVIGMVSDSQTCFLSQDKLISVNYRRIWIHRQPVMVQSTLENGGDFIY